MSRDQKYVRSAPALALAVLAAVVVFALPGRASASVGLTRMTTLRDAVAYRINHVRLLNGRHRLYLRPSLAGAAGDHTRSMARRGYFSHNWWNGTPFGTWIHWYYPGPGYTSWSAGENLYWSTGIPTARGVVRAWMNSAGHRANLLGRWRHLGVSVYRVRNPIGVFRAYSAVTIVTVEFGRRS